MAFKRNDNVVISRAGDELFGRTGRITHLRSDSADVFISGYGTVQYQLYALSSVPTSIDNVAPVPTSAGWVVSVEYVDDPELALPALWRFDRQPSITWANGIIKLEIEGDIHLVRIDCVRRVRVYMA